MMVIDNRLLLIIHDFLIILYDWLNIGWSVLNNVKELILAPIFNESDKNEIPIINYGLKAITLNLVISAWKLKALILLFVLN